MEFWLLQLFLELLWLRSFDDLKDDYESIINNIKKSLNKIEYITKKDFSIIVNNIIEDYSKTKKITKEAKNSLILALNNRWDEIENEIKDKNL